MINTGLTVRRLITTGYHYSKLPVYKSTKHGTIALFIPGHDPPIDLTVFSDVAVNPGPEPAISQANSNNSTLAIKISTSDLHTSNQVQSTPLQYSRDQLKCLRHVHNSVIDTDLYHNLKAIGLFRYRGRRAGKCVKDCSSVDERSIPVKPPTRPENQSLPKVTANLHNVINIPSFLICNARSLAPKVDELECVALQNHVDMSFSWHDLYQLDSCKDKFEYFHHTLSGAVDRFLPTKVSCIHASDKPWMNSKIKSWIAKRQKCLARYGKDSSLFKLWRNRVQQSIKSSKKSFYSSKVKSLKNSNISKWWKAIKSLSGSSLTEGQWYNQLIDGTSIVSLQSLCDKINDFFVGLTADFVPLTHTDVTNIIVYDQQIPEDLLVSTNEAYKALSSIKTKKAPGPDGIPNTVLKLFAYELAPVVANMYNSSLREGFIPPLLKSAAVCPLPKQRPPSSIENDIRPISLTCQIAKVFEGFTLSRILPSILDKLDNNQFAVQGKSTDQALVYLLHLALEALDRGNCSIRLFFADFRKGFDLIDHVILLDKLTKYNCHNCLVRWIAAFLQGRTQFVRLASVCSSSQALNGGIPQGTKLGPILFAVMVNDLISTWRPRAKFVDDLTALEIIPRNSPSIMQFIVDDVQSFSSDNNMKLNPLKCKEMFIDFLHYNSCELQPIVTNGTFIERVKSFKLLGVFISDDLTWAAHCDFVIKKANRRLYALRQLKKAGVPASDIITIYCTLIRSVIEYASVVFASLPSYLSNSLESIQKRALSIIFPGSSYSESLDKSGLPTLVDRRVLICRKFVSSIPSGNPIHPLIHKRVVPSSSSLSLRSGQTHRPMLVKTERFKNFVTVKFQDSRLS